MQAKTATRQKARSIGTRFLAFLDARPRLQLVTLALLLVTAIGVLDYLTGDRLSLSIFFLVPVAISAWHLGWGAGWFTCLLAAATWLLVDLTGPAYETLAIPLWNAGVRLGFFLITAYLLVRLRQALAVQTVLAEHDGLTGLLNSRAFLEQAAAATQLAARHGHPLAIGFLDLDGFKAVNDRFGHGVGNQVLQEVAQTILARRRASDIVGRFGGDEFVIMLPETEPAGAGIFFRSLHKDLQELSRKNDQPVGFSIGVAAFHTAPPQIEEALDAADKVMYRIKRSGKNRVLVETDFEHREGPGLSGISSAQ